MAPAADDIPREDPAQDPRPEPSTSTGPVPTSTGSMPTITGSIPTITGAIPVLEDPADHDIAHLPDEEELRRTRGKVTAIVILVLTTLSAIGPLATDMYIPAFPEVAEELGIFMDALEGIQLEYPVFVDVEANSLTSLSRTQLTGLVQYAMDILYQRKWYAGWYSYTNFINTYLNAGALSNYPLWVADYRSRLGYQGSYTMWQYSGSGTCDGVDGAVDLDYSYTDFLPAIRAGGFNNYGESGPNMVSVSDYILNVFGSQTEYFYTANVNDVVGYLPLGNYPVTRISRNSFGGYDWVILRYNGGEYWTPLLEDRNRLEPAPNRTEETGGLQGGEEL